MTCVKRLDPGSLLHLFSPMIGLVKRKKEKEKEKSHVCYNILPGKTERIQDLGAK